MFKKPEYPEVDPVVLKPFHGIRPAYYILFLFFLFLLFVFFVLCLLPGLVSDTAYISVETPLSSVGVYEDGRYLSSASGTVIKTHSGKHSYSFTYEGITIGETEENIPRRYFFTIFSHKVYTIKPALTYTDEAKEKAENEFAYNGARYSHITDYTGDVKYLPLFKEFAECAAEMDIENIEDIWLYGMLHISSKTMYDDYKDALSILDKNKINYESNESKTLKSYLTRLYEDNKVDTIALKDESSPITLTKDGAFYRYEGGTITLGKTGETSYPESESLPQTLSYDSFYISQNLITENEYAIFVENNPKWSKSNIENLINEGLVDSSYLADINLSSRSSRPIRYISYYAALAYAEWKGSVDSTVYSLPTLTEWTVAAESAENKKYVDGLIYRETDDSTPTALMGQLWDMTESVYMPLMRLIDSSKVSYLSSLYPYDDIIVMGGSYINKNITINTIGTATKESCSEFNGFRLVKHD